jgi:predicted Zn-dependent protease with MMP-like domain
MNICDANGNGSDPCQDSFGTGVSANFTGVPGNDPTWQYCSAPPTVVNTDTCPCADWGRLYKFGGYVTDDKSPGEGTFAFWRNPHNNGTSMETVERVLWNDNDAKDESTIYFKDDAQNKRYAWPLDEDWMGQDGLEKMQNYGLGGTFGVFRKDKPNEYVKIQLRKPTVNIGGLKESTWARFTNALKNGQALNQTYSFVPTDAKFLGANWENFNYGCEEASVPYCLFPNGSTSRLMKEACEDAGGTYKESEPLPITKSWGQSQLNGPDYSSYKYNTKNGLGGFNGPDWSNTSIRSALTAQQMMDEVTSAFNQWADLFNDVYKDVKDFSVSFTNLGLENPANWVGNVNGIENPAQYIDDVREKPKKPQALENLGGFRTAEEPTEAFKDLSWNSNNTAGWPGGFRFSLVDFNIKNENTLASMKPLADVFSDSHNKPSSDIMINANVCWRLDSQTANYNLIIDTTSENKFFVPSFSGYEKDACDTAKLTKEGWNLSDLGAFPNAIGCGWIARNDSPTIPVQVKLQGTGERTVVVAKKMWADGFISLYPKSGNTKSLQHVIMHEIGHSLAFDHEKDGWHMEGLGNVEGDKKLLFSGPKKPFSLDRPASVQDAAVQAAQPHKTENYFSSLRGVHRTHWKEAFVIMSPSGPIENLRELFPNGEAKNCALHREYAEALGLIHLAKHNPLGYRKATILQITENTLSQPLKIGEEVWICYEPDMTEKMGAPQHLNSLENIRTYERESFGWNKPEPMQESEINALIREINEGKHDNIGPWDPNKNYIDGKELEKEDH